MRDWVVDGMLGFMSGLHPEAFGIAEVALTGCPGGVSASQRSGTAPTCTNGQEADKNTQRKNTHSI
jgi:hypothetical protein